MQTQPDRSTDGSLRTRGTLATEVCNRLKHDILTGALGQGERLSEMYLAELYGVSATPVREAMRMLAAAGLVEYLDRRGVRVIRLTTEQIDQAFGVRLALEREALKEAVPRMSQADRTRLVDLARRLDDVRGAPTHSVLEADREFHAHFVRCARNPWLNDFAERMGNVLTVARLDLFAMTDVDHVLRDHLEIAIAVMNDDLLAADAALERHLRRVRDNAIAAHERAQAASTPAGRGVS